MIRLDKIVNYSFQIRKLLLREERTPPKIKLVQYNAGGYDFICSKEQCNIFLSLETEERAAANDRKNTITHSQVRNKFK